MADDIFSEIDDDLRAERSRGRNRRLAIVGLVVLAVAAIGLGIWQYGVHRHQARILAAAPAYFAAQADADAAALAAAGPDAALTPEQQRAIPAFRKLAETAPDGFATLSRFRLAALQWRAGDHPAALAAWNAIADDGRAQADFRGLAALLLVQHQIDTADPAVLKLRLRPALEPNSPWRLLAQEADAFIDLKQNAVAAARGKLAAISQDPAASESQRARASGVLETLDPSKPTDSLKTGG
ncbi:MAG: hypothetical protein INR65_02805 [Gluconacetobacter diazotrophicus]|nr:hypothetical protein [Gluconacetobacter diazotrophicus]